MIPIALPSTEWLLVVGGLLLLSIIWIFWSLMLIFSAASRKRLIHLRLVIYLFCTAVALFVIYQIYTVTIDTQQAMQKLQKEYYPVLSHPQRIGQIEMPAKTELSLLQANTLESFQHADFPHAIKIQGINANSVERYVSYEYDKQDYSVTKIIPKNMSVRGTGITQQAGWRCDANLAVKFTLHADGAIADFDGCQLAESETIDGVIMPLKTVVTPTQGDAWTDGFVDQDRWLLDTDIDLSFSNIVEIDGLPLVAPHIYLDAHRKIYTVIHTELARTVTFGGITHPKGTLVNLNPRPLRKHYAGSWIFVPPTKTPEMDLDILGGFGSGEQRTLPNIVQDRSGHLLARDISL